MKNTFRCGWLIYFLFGWCRNVIFDFLSSYLVHAVLSRACSSFTVLQHLAIWGNLVAFYIINWIVSAIPSSGMYTIMFRLCKQPSYWLTMIVSLSLLYSLTIICCVLQSCSTWLTLSTCSDCSYKAIYVRS